MICQALYSIFHGLSLLLFPYLYCFELFFLEPRDYWKQILYLQGKVRSLYVLPFPVPTLWDYIGYIVVVVVHPRCSKGGFKFCSCVIIYNLILIMESVSL